MEQMETEFMRLAPGYGIIPKEFRNRGYDKLEWGPGEGGIRMGPKTKPADDRISAFLAGVAAGADPKQLAGNLLGDAGKPNESRAKRGTRKETV